MSIPFHHLRDNPGEIDLLVPADPVWETAWLVDTLPAVRFDPTPKRTRLEDGGGSALNSACALAAVGRRVVAVGCVGDDEEGKKAIEALARRGVETRIEIVSGRATVRTDLFVERSTGRTAFRAILPENRAATRLGRIDGLDSSTFLLLDHPSDEAIEWFRSRRSAVGRYNVLNLNEPTSIGRRSDRLARLLPHVDILQIPEAAGGTDPHPPADPTAIHHPRPHPVLSENDVAEIFAAGVGLLIRTRGPHGVLLQTKEAPALALPARGTELLDPTGAGDAFTAGCLDALLSGGTLAEAAGQGVDWAARAVRQLGARGWLDREPPEPFACGAKNR